MALAQEVKEMICPNCHSEFEAAPFCPHCGMLMFKQEDEGGPKNAEELCSRSMVLQGQWDQAQFEAKKSTFDSIYKYLVVGLLAFIAIVETARFIFEIF